MNHADLEIIASPLFPLASRTHVRATYEAERRGLVCVPSTYPLTVGVNAGGTSVAFTLDVPRDQGPLVVTEIIPPKATAHLRQQMRVRVAQEQKTDGNVAALDVAVIPREYCGRLMSAPLCVGGGQQLQVSFDDDAVYSATEGMTVNGLSVRGLVANRRSLCDVPIDVAADWLAAVKEGGEWWAMTVFADQNGANPGTITSDVVVEAVVIAQKATAIEGEVHASDVQIKASPYIITPTTGPLYGTLVSPDTVVVLPGLRWPIAGGTQLAVDLLYAAGTHIPVRVSLIGRRGGIVGGCW